MRGVDLEQLLRGPVRRFIAVLKALWLERASNVYKEEERRELQALVEWPEAARQREELESDRAARAAMARVGVSVDFGALAAARARAAEERRMRAEQAAVGHNDPVLEPEPE